MGPYIRSDRSFEGYRTAQVCLNGHPITSKVETSRALVSDFCGKCGAKTITHCLNCSSSIRGKYEAPGVAVITSYQPESFCYSCGEPYPWMEGKLQAAKELADELDELTLEQREKLKISIDDLAKDSPRTELAVTRFKKILAQAPGQAAVALRDITVQIASEAAKKMLLGN